MGLFKKDNAQHFTLNISGQMFVRVPLLIIATVITLAAVRKASHALVLLFIAFFLALALNTPVHWISQHLPGKRRGNRSIATTVSFLIVVLLLGAFIASLVPPLVKQTQSFVNNAPHLVQDLRSQNSEAGKLLRKFHLNNQLDNFSSQLSDRLKHAGGAAFSTISRIGSSIFSSLTILALTFMMLVEGPRWLQFLRRLVPKQRRDDVDQLTHDMYRVVKGYVNGQVILAAIAAGFISIALFVLHVSYPAALVFIVFICGLIPMVGHTLGAIIVTAVTATHSVTHAIIILLYYFLYQQIENYLIQPRIQANSTNLSPLLVFASVVVGVSFNGLLGGLVAIPIAGCLRILALYYLESENKLSKAEVEKTIEPEKKPAL